ncbi:MAG: hypothetical protein BroJett030_19850 [Alphaproteobacteria bacterium]|nr:MAG: hypothetical protein BroJett030_19850 [Alphaproteobacteria bacterium]
MAVAPAPRLQATPGVAVAEPGGAERRGAGREAARDLSEIWIAGSKVPITCLVRDISATGARIEAATATLPNRFVLTNFARRCRVVVEVVWRRDRHCGVRFITPPRSLEAVGR